MSDEDEHFDVRMQQFERVLLEQGLRSVNGHVNKAAERLNLTTKTLYRKMKKYQLDKKIYK